MEQERLLELINMDIDGIISGDEKKILLEYLNSNTDAKKLYEDTALLSKMLSSQPVLVPPENIKKAVMNAVSLKPHEKKQKNYSNSIFNLLRRTAMSMDPMRKKKVILVTSFISIVIVAIIVVAIFTPAFKSSQSGEITDGTIGKAKKYYAQQMSEKDIVLRNALLNYKEDLNLAISELNEYKKFVIDFDTDLETWISKLSAIEIKSKEKAAKAELDKYASQLAILRNVKSIIANRGILDSTLLIFTDLSKSDTLNKNFPVENSIVDLKKFMEKVSINFVKAFNTLPEISETFKNNGEPEILVIKSAKDMKEKVGNTFKDKKMQQLFVKDGYCCFFTSNYALSNFFNQNNIIEYLNKDQQPIFIEACLKNAPGAIAMKEEVAAANFSNMIVLKAGVLLGGSSQSWIAFENFDKNAALFLFSKGLPASAIFAKNAVLCGIILEVCGAQILIGSNGAL